MGLWEEDLRGKVSSHHIMSCTVNVSCRRGCWPCSAGWHSVCPVSPLWTPPSASHTLSSRCPLASCTLRKGVTMHSPQLRRGQLGSTALRVDLGVSYIRNSSVRKICLFPSLYLGISLNQYGLIDLILLVIIQHYSIQIVPVLATESSSVGSSVLLAYSLHCSIYLSYMKPLPYFLAGTTSSLLTFCLPL